jgi:hypothetical protein
VFAQIGKFSVRLVRERKPAATADCLIVLVTVANLIFLPAVTTTNIIARLNRLAVLIIYIIFRHTSKFNEMRRIIQTRKPAPKPKAVFRQRCGIFFFKEYDSNSARVQAFQFYF